MRKGSLLIAAALAIIPNIAEASDEISEVNLSAGKRIDQLNWNIAGISPYGNFVNVLSELAWRDLESSFLKASTRIFLDSFYIRGSAGYGFITSGTNQDSDYRGNDRTLEYSRSNNASNDGSVWDIEGGLGYVFGAGSPGNRLSLMPMAGLSYHKQNLKMTDGYQTITYPGGPALGPFSGLNSTYSSRWAGPWAGADLSYVFRDLTLLGSFEYHLAYFRAEADWNLRTNFAHPVSFEQWARGTGVVISLGAEYNLGRNWSLGGTYDMQDFHATDGTDRTFFSDGSEADTPLNEVNWESQAVMVGINYRF